MRPQPPAVPPPTPTLPCVLVVDDQAAVREGLARLIRAQAPGARIVGTAANGAEALRKHRELRPQLVILDVDLAGADGLELLPALRHGSHVLVLSAHGDADTRRRALWLGAAAFVDKAAPSAELLCELARCAPATLQFGEDKAPGGSGASSQR